MEAIETIETDKLIIEVYQDDMPENPREAYGNFGHMVCFHNRYELGDKNHGFTSESFYDGDGVFQEYEDSPEGFLKYLERDDVISLPLYLYDHSGISMRTYLNNRPGGSYWQYPEWDAGKVGYIYVTKAEIRKEYGVKHVSKQMIAKVQEYLKGEVETYDQYLRGEVYGYTTRCKTCDQELDSCWGFIGDYHNDYFMECAKGSECKDCHETAERLDKVTQLEFNLQGA